MNQGWEILASSWYEPKDFIASLIQGKRLGADSPFSGAEDLSDEMARIRSLLTEEEVERFRSLGRICAEAMREEIHTIRPGQNEYQIAGRLAEEAEGRGVHWRRAPPEKHRRNHKHMFYHAKQY